jgi:exodeoxyribonuclease-3
MGDAGRMRIVAWNCNMALDRKLELLLALAPDIAVVSECAAPERFRLRCASPHVTEDPVWIGRNPHKGLAVFTFNGYTARLAPAYNPTLRYVAPIHVSGPTEFHLLAVWAQNASGGITRKRQIGPLRRALVRYRAFLGERATIVAGDLNSNAIWDKPGWRNNHTTTVALLAGLGLVSAYHATRGEAHGAEREPTLYWRDRTKDGPTYHIDYVFLPQPWIGKVTQLSIGTFEDWCGFSDHVPVVVDVAL